MNNKFYRKDISRFDPTNASAEDVRKWLFAIIDAELEKDPEERDYDLIAECSEFEAELPESDVELSESEYVAGLECIKAKTPAAEHKATKISEPKKKPKKTVRIVAILAASIAVLMLSLTVAAAVQGKPIVQFISDNIKAILGMDAGDKLEDGSITLVKYGEFLQYSSVEEAISSLEYHILYPSYLPEGVEIERIVVNEYDDNILRIIFVSSFEALTIELNTPPKTSEDKMKDLELYNNGEIDFYILKKSSCYQVFSYCENVEYNIMYHDYEELIKILNGMKEIEK